AQRHISWNDYDLAGNLVAEHYADGGQVTHEYDALGREIRRYNVEGNLAVTNTYDRDNRLIAEQLPYERKEYTYDEAGNRTSSADVASAGTHRSVYFFDTRGNIVRTLSPNFSNDLAYTQGFVTVDTYDPLGRKISEKNADGDTQTWNYDYFGRLQSQTDL